MRSFVAVAIRRSFTRAAEDQHIAQQALSQQIRSLEKTMGVKLLNRTSRRVELTLAGAVFLEEAKKVLAAADEAVERALLASSGQAGHLRLVYTLTAAYDTMPTLIDRCKTELPDASVEAREVWAEDLPGILLEGHADVGILPVSPLPDGLRRVPIRHEPLVALLPPEHPLANRRVFSLSALRDEVFLVWPRPMSPGFFDVIVNACRAAGFEPRIDVREAGHTIWTAIAAGHGVGLTVASLRRTRPEGIRIVNLARPRPSMTLEAVTTSADSPLTRGFLSLANSNATLRGWLDVPPR
jgi:DNA-binding transcriptional LysR family regulator